MHITVIVEGLWPSVCQYRKSGYWRFNFVGIMDSCHQPAISEWCCWCLSTLSGCTFLARADLPMTWYSNCIVCLLWRTGITLSVLYYAFCWHQTDLQSSFIIHGLRLSASRSTKCRQDLTESERERKSQQNVPEGLTHTQSSPETLTK